MFRRKREVDVVTPRPVEARGGVSGGAILTGVVVAFGAMFLLSAVIGGVLTAMGVEGTEVTEGEAVTAGIGAGIAFVVAQFLAYAWGGYTAGRMGRGAGVVNGILVPVIAIALALATGAIVASLGATANLNLPFTENRLPLENDYLVDWGVGIAIGAVVAMFLGAAIGGAAGARWHTKLEQDVYGETPIKTRDGLPADTGVPVSRGATTAPRTREDTLDLTNGDRSRPVTRTYR